MHSLLRPLILGSWRTFLGPYLHRTVVLLISQGHLVLCAEQAELQENAKHGECGRNYYQDGDTCSIVHLLIMD